MDNEKFLTFANAIYQNAKVGMQSIDDIMPKIEEEKLRKELIKQYVKYRTICERVINVSKKHNVSVEENSFMEKAKLWASINMSTLFNKQTRHIAELLLIGTEMGILTCYKDRADHPKINEKLMEILNDLETIQEENYNNLKVFLKNKK